MPRPLPPLPGDYPPFYPAAFPPDLYNEPTSTFPAGTLLHKGFYDLLAMIPTPSPSQLFWGAPSPPLPSTPQQTTAGPRYEHIGPTSTRPLPPAVVLKKGRRVSKDMVSKPTGFVWVFCIRPTLKAP